MWTCSLAFTRRLITNRRPLRVRSRRHQRGITLIESLVAFTVMSLGAVSVLRLQRELRFNADLSGQRAEASHLGQSSIERQRAAAGLIVSPVSRQPTLVPGRNTQFALSTSTSTSTSTLPFDAVAPGASISSVAVDWTDRTGAARSVALESVVTTASPLLSAALSLRPIDSRAVRHANRSAAIPMSAVDVGTGRSAWKPSSTDSTVWLFDNATGHIVSRCSNASAVGLAHDLTVSDLGLCAATRATLLTGIIRTSLATPPLASKANELPEAMSVVLTLSVPAQVAHPSCDAESQRSVQAFFGSGSGAAVVARRMAVPIDATPASIGASSLTELGDRFVAYRCVVPETTGGWTGRTTIVPPPLSRTSADVPTLPPAAGDLKTTSAWKIGIASDDRKVCRYTGMVSNDDSVAQNAAHPAEYAKVTESLSQQNFLVIRGNQSCPGPLDGDTLSTTQQQP